MNVLIAYFSKFGNTKMIAQAIGDGFRSSACSVRVICVEQLTFADLGDSDLLVMGSPTHRMNLPHRVRRVLDTLPKGVLHGVPMAAFDTSYKMNWLLTRFTAARKLDKKLRRLGGMRIIRPQTSTS